MDTQNQNIHAGHRARLLEQIYKSGLDNMTEVQVLEFVLTFFVPRKDTNELAHRLINEFGNLKNVLDASSDELIKVKGIGERIAKLISLLPQVFFFYRESGLKSNKTFIHNLKDAAKFLQNLFESKANEEFYMLFLNANNQLFRIEKIASGNVNEVNFSCQNIVNLALKHKPSYIILSHNHPNGFKEPSQADIQTTLKIAKLLQMNSFLISDHIIVGSNGYYSFNEHHILQQIYQGDGAFADEKFSNQIFENLVKSVYTY